MRLSEDISRIKQVMTLLTEKVENGEIICDNCGWSWKISEGGDDTYICHKCWHDNQPNPINEDTSFDETVKRVLTKRPLLDDTFKEFFIGKNGMTLEKARHILIRNVLGGFDNIIKNNLDFLLSKHHVESGGYNFDFKIKNYHVNEDLKRIDFWAIVDGTVSLVMTGDYEPRNLKDVVNDEEIGWEVSMEIQDELNDYFYENFFKRTGIVVDSDGFSVGKIR
jgi:hypothetical protein